MVETKATIDKIISEIETNTPVVPQQGKMNINQVMEILLDRNTVATESVGEPSVGNSEYNFDMSELKRWRDKNNQIYSIKLERPLYSNRPVIGKLVVFVKKVTRKLLRPVLYPILTEQNEFNASVTASINALYNNELTTQQFIYTQKEVNETIKVLNQRIQILEQKEPSNSYEKINYASFESYFRGNEEDIKKTQSSYIPYFEGKQNVLDLGCGRGEFLQLLKENNISAIGVDSFGEFVQKCKSSGLEVIQGDAIDYIKQVAEKTLGGIFASQLVEHLSIQQLVELCNEAYKKLEDGGCIVLETPNPTCLSIYTNAFYIDPSHVKPVHPKLLEFILREAGFEKIEVVYTESSKIGYRLPLLDMKEAVNISEFNDGINLLSDVIFGSQDYAIIATK
ncbi:MAG: class I SAM-dependent methyltransferase [Lachnospiraceae bacterium]|nr:class I SAM-dependent methyltransferase [Lachnospiraceae bacterium]